jgi:hypothetical protein
LSLRAIGTAREIADRNLARLRKKLIKYGIDHGVIERKINDWLEYRQRHEQAGTLDEEQYL